MTLDHFKLARPAASRTSIRPADAPAVPVKEMAPINRANVADAVEITRLLALPFPAFTQVVARLLETLGYANVQAMKAMHGQGKGRNAHGGYDLRMFLPTRLTRGLVIAQVKQYREPVPRSFVDELRGTMLRLGASQGLLVTTGAFAASAIEAAQAAQSAAPVCLLDGQELARLLREQPQALTAALPPAPAMSAPAPKLKPLSREESERRHQEFLDGLGPPPDEKARNGTPAMPEPENVTLALRLHVCLAPARHGGKSTGECTAPAEERGQG